MYSVSYLAIFEPDEEEGYTVYFPDVPECYGSGNSYEEAKDNATEALAHRLYRHLRLGMPLPKPSPIPKLRSSRLKVPPGRLSTLIKVYPDLIKRDFEDRRIKTTITLPAWLKEIAEEEGVNYSRLLEGALIDYLGIDVYFKKRK